MRRHCWIPGPPEKCIISRGSKNRVATTIQYDTICMISLKANGAGGSGRKDTSTSHKLMTWSGKVLLENGCVRWLLKVFSGARLWLPGPRHRLGPYKAKVRLSIISVYSFCTNLHLMSSELKEEVSAAIVQLPSGFAATSTGCQFQSKDLLSLDHTSKLQLNWDLAQW